MSTTAPEYLTTLRDGFAEAVQQWLDQTSTAWDQWAQAWSPLAEAGASAVGMPRARPGAKPHHGGHHHRHHGHQHGDADESGCGCGKSGGGTSGCGCGGQGEARGCCQDVCDCCVPEADVVVMARAGEVRVVPFRLHNPWRRERQVTLEVGPWHVCDGDGLDVRARLEETELTLGPCEDRIVRLLVSPRAKADDPKGQDGPPPKPSRAAAKEAKDAAQEQWTAARLPHDGGDVESCASAYADVRFEGCAKPQRVAVVVLPAECEPVDVGCDCGCCC
jgi:hypothetical protein